MRNDLSNIMQMNIEKSIYLYIKMISLQYCFRGTRIQAHKVQEYKILYKKISWKESNKFSRFGSCTRFKALDIKYKQQLK